MRDSWSSTEEAGCSGRGEARRGEARRGERRGGERRGEAPRSRLHITADSWLSGRRPGYAQEKKMAQRLSPQPQFEHFGLKFRHYHSGVFETLSMQSKHDIRLFWKSPADSKSEGRKCAYETLFLNNSRERGEEKGLSLWDAISVLYKLTQDTSPLRSEVLLNRNKDVIIGPTASLGRRLDLEILEKYVFNISNLDMPVARLFKFQLSYNCILAIYFQKGKRHCYAIFQSFQ